MSSHRMLSNLIGLSIWITSSATLVLSWSNGIPSSLPWCLHVTLKRTCHAERTFRHTLRQGTVPISSCCRYGDSLSMSSTSMDDVAATPSRLSRRSIVLEREILLDHSSSTSSTADVVSSISQSLNQHMQQIRPLVMPPARTVVSIRQPKQAEAVVVQQLDDVVDDAAARTYRNGLITVGSITLLFASNSPALHAAFSAVSHQPPVLLLNAAVSMVALVGVTGIGPLLQRILPQPDFVVAEMVEDDGPSQLSMTTEVDRTAASLLSSWNGLNPAMRGGMELAVWKTLGTVANLYGLSLTSANHGAFLIQLTTLIVPLAQGMMGVPIPTRLWTAIGCALAGVYMFTQDVASSGASAVAWQGDALCVVAAIFYATYDLRVFEWGKRVQPLQLITTKVATQAVLSIVLLLAGTNMNDISSFVTGLLHSSTAGHDAALIAAVVLWSGVIINGVVPYVQVGGQQAVGPSRAQIVYASQPLWAAIMSYFFLNEQVAPAGMAGGAAFLTAILLAATAEMPQSSTTSKGMNAVEPRTTSTVLSSAATSSS